MKTLAVLLICLATPVFATQDRWPALFDVTGVAAQDVLNLREAPSASSAIVGSLPPDARNIEVIRPNDRETWGLVNTGDGTGWVSLSFLARQPGQIFGSLPDRAFCAGTEPFWSLDIDAGSVRFDRPGEQSHVGRIDSNIRSNNHPGTHALVGIFERSAGARYLDVVAMMSNEACTDGMSDRAYGYSVDVITGNTEGFDMWSGCCTLSR